MGGKILIVTGDLDPTVDSVVLCLQAKRARFERFHPDAFPMRASLSLTFSPDRAPGGAVAAPGAEFLWNDVRSVWYRRSDAPLLPEGMSKDEREFAARESAAVLAGMWRLLDAFWVNHPDKNRIGEAKPLQLAIAQRLGFRIPRTLFTNDPEQVLAFCTEMEGRTVYKAMTQNVLGRDRQQCIYTTRLTPDHLGHVDLLRHAPGLFQEEVPKVFDLRITVIGDKVFPVEIHSQQDERGVLDWRRGEVPKLEHVVHRLPEPLEHSCRQLTRHFGLNYAAIDMIMTQQKEYVFLEINPNGQFGWIETMTGLPLTETLADLLIDAAAS